MKKLEKLEIISKKCNLTKGIGIENEKVCKLVRDQTVWNYVENTL